MPSSELEALVGHLFVVGGRSISTASPGAIAMPPPRRTARGRDLDTLFALITLSEEQSQPAAFYEGLAHELSTRYFNVPGSVTSALRDSINAINSLLYRANASALEPIRVGLACAILREQELYLAVTGPARCFLIREDFIERLPTNEELAEGAPALGLDAELDMRFYRREVRAGDFLILADASLNRLRDTTLRQATESGEIDGTLSNLASVAGRFTAAEVIKLVAPLAEGETEAIPRESRPPREGVRPAVPPGPPAAVQRPVSGAESPPAPPARELGRFRQAGRDTVRGMARATAGLRTLIERIFPEREQTPDRQIQLPVAMQVGVMVAVAVIVALITTAVYRMSGQNSQYAQLIHEAQREIELARAGGNNQAEARPHWETALFLFEQAAQIHNPSAEILAQRAEALAALDSYDHVTRVTPVLLREYQPGAYLRGPVVQGLNLYLLDTTSDILYREDLDESGTRLVNREPQVVTRQGEMAGNQVVGGLIDLVWMEDGGVPQRNVLAVLARNGLLITYSPSWAVTAAILPGFGAWQDPRAIAIYNRDLYILDAGANQIWRYRASADSYSSNPENYFTDVTPQLADAIDMEIDTNGNVYVLHGDGRISKYFMGREELFGFEGLPQPIARPTAFFMNLSPYDRAFFIADAGGGRLYTTSLTGTFLSNYKDSGDTIFDTLSGVFNLDRPPYVYLTSANRLYYFARP
jgi:hypothetical protein